MEVPRNDWAVLFPTESIMKAWEILNEESSFSPYILNKQSVGNLEDVYKTER